MIDEPFQFSAAGPAESLSHRFQPVTKEQDSSLPLAGRCGAAAPHEGVGRDRRARTQGKAFPYWKEALVLCCFASFSDDKKYRGCPLDSASPSAAICEAGLLANRCGYRLSLTLRSFEWSKQFSDSCGSFTRLTRCTQQILLAINCPSSFRARRQQS